MVSRGTEEAERTRWTTPDGVAREANFLCVFAPHFFLPSIHLSFVSFFSPARERFYTGRTMISGVQTDQLNNTTAPEQKRKIIGDTFMHVSEDELVQFGLDPAEVFLAQGTLRPDLIESASSMATVAGTADVIKTHHNDTALVRELRAAGRIIEPLRSDTMEGERGSASCRRYCGCCSGEALMFCRPFVFLPPIQRSPQG